jgi:uncharacterized cupredoxin-like copper-binding protein
VLAALALACNGEADAHSGDAGNPSLRAAADSAAQAGAQANAPASSPEHSDAGDSTRQSDGPRVREAAAVSTVRARLSEYSIDLTPDSALDGRVTFTIENEGARVHTILIRGNNGMRWRSLAVAPGAHTTIATLMDPGEYGVMSAEPVYVERGMRATLVVR